MPSTFVYLAMRSSRPTCHAAALGSAPHRYGQSLQVTRSKGHAGFGLDNSFEAQAPMHKTESISREPCMSPTCHRTPSSTACSLALGVVRGRLGSEPLKLAARRISSEASLEAMQGSANCCSVHKPSSVSCTQVAIACRKTCSCTKTQQTPCGQKSLPQRPAASRQPLAPKLLHHSTLNLAKAIERHEPCANSHNCSNCWASQRMPVRTTVRSLEMLKAPP